MYIFILYEALPCLSYLCLLKLYYILSLYSNRQGISTLDGLIKAQRRQTFVTVSISTVSGFCLVVSNGLLQLTPSKRAKQGWRFLHLRSHFRQEEEYSDADPGCEALRCGHECCTITCYGAWLLFLCTLIVVALSIMFRLETSSPWLHTPHAHNCSLRTV